MKIFIEKIEQLTLLEIYQALRTNSPFSYTSSTYDNHQVICQFVSLLNSENLEVNHEEAENGIACLKWILEHKIVQIYALPHVLSEKTLFSPVNLIGLAIKYDQQSTSSLSNYMSCFLRVLVEFHILSYVNEKSDLSFQVKSRVEIPTNINNGYFYMLFMDDIEFIQSHVNEHVDSNMVLLQANIDDMNPEILPYVMERLFSAGANDVFFQPITMKKGRSAYMLNVLCQSNKVIELESMVFLETTTIGIRRIKVDVHRLSRLTEVINTRWGEIKIKIARHLGAIIQVSPEYEDCKRLAMAHKIPLKMVYQEAVSHIQNLYGEYVVTNRQGE